MATSSPPGSSATDPPLLGFVRVCVPAALARLVTVVVNDAQVPANTPVPAPEPAAAVALRIASNVAQGAVEVDVPVVHGRCTTVFAARPA